MQHCIYISDQTVYNILFLTLTFVSFKMGLQFQQQKCVFSLFSPLSILYTLVNNRCAALSVSQSVVEQAVHSKYSTLENRESVVSSGGKSPTPLTLNSLYHNTRKLTFAVM